MNADRRRLLKLIPSTSLALLSGCHNSEEDKTAKEAPKAKVPGAEEKAADDSTKKLILFCAADLNDPFLKMQSTLMQTAARRLGLRYQVLDAGGDASVQLTQFASASQLKPIFLIISPVEDHLPPSFVETIHSGGMFVIGLDERLPEDACHSVVFVSQKKLGRQAGQFVVEALQRKAKEQGKPQVTGRVVQLLGDASSFAATARSEGFLEVLKTEPGIVIVHEAPGGWSRENAKARTVEALRLQHQFDVVFAHNDSMAQGASDALAATQLRGQVLIVGMGGAKGPDGGLEMVGKSVIDATIVLPVPMQSALEIIEKREADKDHQPPKRMELTGEVVRRPTKSAR